MKLLLIIAAALSFIALADLPAGFYTLLRIYLTIVSVIVAFFEYDQKQTVNIWVVLFGVTAIIFNPIIPVYLYEKSAWMLINIAVGVLCAVSAFKIESISKGKV